MSKACTRCGEVQPLSAFSKDARRSDGLRNKCRTCVRAGDQAYRAANLERVRESTRERARHYRIMDAEQRAEAPEAAPAKPRRTPMTVEQRREYQRKWRAEWRRNNPEAARDQWRKYQPAATDYLSQWRKA